MRVLVVGGSGFLGSHLVDRLGGENVEVISADLVPPRWSSPPRFAVLNVLDADAVRATVAELAPDVIVNLSGVLGTAETFDHAARTFNVNTAGAANLLDSCRHHNVGYIGVQTGTEWLNPYAISKRAATELTFAYREAFQIRAAVLRIYNAYGPRQDGLSQVNKVVPRFIACALQGSPLPIYGDGHQVMDLVPVDLCTSAFLAAIKKLKKIDGTIVQVGTGIPTSVNALAERVIDAVGEGKASYLPRRIGEGSHYKCADTKSLTKELGVMLPEDPFILLARTIDWYRVQLGS